ncbi:hypothetical protein ACWC5I_46920, partial [Kitasatospora sp. NPDC001574]
PYTEAEWTRLIKVCRSKIADSYARHREALALADSGCDPAEGGWTDQNILWLLKNHGPDGPITHLTRALGPKRRARGAITGAQARALLESLYPSTRTVIPYRILFGTLTGIVPDGIDDLGLDDIDWAGDERVLLDYVKGRTAAESLALSRGATRLLEQWLAHSALTRTFAPVDQRHRLWIRFVLRSQWCASPPAYEVYRRWTDDQGLVDDHGRPFRIHLHRIRTTHGAMRDRRFWRGSRRSTIDPNRSPGVEGDSYLTAGTTEQRDAAEDVAVTAVGDLVRRAQPPVVLDGEDVTALVRAYPRQVAALGLDDEVLRQLAGGERDVFSAACADQLSGLHGPKGKPCPARPWVCLLCPLALFAPRHLPNLLRLRAFFSRQWNQMTNDHFMAVFGPYAQRLDEILQPGVHFTRPQLDQAATEVADRDDELPLRPEETTA